MNVDGLGNVVERRPWQVIAAGAFMFIVTLAGGVAIFCTPGRNRYDPTPLLLKVDAHGRPDWAWVGPTIAFILLLSAGMAALTVIASRSVFRIDPEHAGLRLDRLGETRFVPYAVITGVAAEGSKLALVVRHHGSFRIGTRMRGATDVRELRDEIVRRMQRAREEPPAQPVLPPAPAHDDEPLLAPGGRSVAGWLSDLRKMAGDTGYRDAAMSAERMWHVLENRHAQPAVRAAAAVVLTGGGSANATGTATDAHARLHAIANACEDNHLRVALERIARRAGDEELRRALEPLCADQPIRTT